MRQLVISSVQKDFIASNLRSQVATLQWLLKNIEDAENTESDYTIESLKRMEKDLRKLRNFLDN